MTEINVTLKFERAFKGELVAKNITVPIGSEAGTLAPYDMMLGALGSCYYSNFRGITEKMRLEYERVDISVRGVKREEIPTLLKEVEMVVTVYGAKEQKGFARAAELAGKYCSVHETIAQVAKIHTELRFAE